MSANLVVRIPMLLLAGLVLTGSAQAPFDAALTQSVRVAPLPANGGGSNEMLEMLRTLARNARIPIGVQLARPSDSLATAPAAVREVSTLRDALTRMVAPGYEWRLVDSVVIIRPKAAWSDPQDVLNQPVPPLRLDRETLPDVMQSVISRLYGRGGSPSPRTGLLSGPFSGGCILDLMALATRLDSRSTWVVSYGPAWGGEKAKFGLAVMDFDGHSTTYGYVQPPPRRF